MKILFSPAHFLHSSNVGSEFSWAYNLSHKLAKLNPGSVIITGATDTPSENIISLSSRFLKTAWSHPNSAIFNCCYLCKEGLILRKQNFDIIQHVLPFGLGQTINWASWYKKQARFVVGPIQAPFRNHEVINKSKTEKLMDWVISLVSPLLSYLSDQTLKSADVIIAVNNTAKKALLERHIPANKIRVIPIGINTDQFTFGVRQLTKAVKILTIGRLEQRKNQTGILKAMALIGQVYPEATLTILGQGKDKGNLLSLAEELHIQTRVTFIDSVPYDKMAAFYQQFQLFLNLSREESFSSSCLEAMASGLPIVSSRVGGFNEAIENGRNGFLVNVDDYKNLALQAIKLLNDPDLMANIAQEARKTIEEKYDWDQCIIPEYQKIYAELNKKVSS